jgi:lipoprotein-releasing system ATP-binding protein
MLEARDIRKAYPTPGAPLVILDELSLTLRAGEFLSIMGPSGSGKSTLLNILGTLDTPTSGTVTFDGVNPFDLSDRALARFRNERIGFIFQEHHLLPQCTVLENALLPTLASARRATAPHAAGPRGSQPPCPDVAARNGDDPEAQARALLEGVGLGGRLEHLPGELSGGERQRVAIVRALVNRPALVLADEPTGNLDHAAASGVAELLIELVTEQHTTLVVATHSMTLADRAPLRMMLVDGRLAER